MVSFTDQFSLTLSYSTQRTHELKRPRLGRFDLNHRM